MLLGGGGGGGGGGPSEVHISIPHRNLSRGYVWGALIIKLLFYRGGSSYYLLRGSVNNIPMETGTSTVIYTCDFPGEGVGA